MKTRRLSEIDLARLCALVDRPEELHLATEAYDAGGGAWSYDPARRSEADAVNAQPPLPIPLDRPAWEKLERQVTRTCTRGQKQVDSNIEVTKLLHDLSVREGWVARTLDLSSMPIGVNETVRYWSNLVIEGPEGRFLTFIDHRRNGGLSGAVPKRIVHSMQSAWLHARYPDLEGTRLAIIQFPALKQIRSIKLTFCDTDDLMSYEELNERVLAVYLSWGGVADRLRKKAGGKGS